MKIIIEKKYIVIFSVAIALILIILLLPLEFLEFLSLEVVGEPPINGRSWIEGVEAVGGSLSMRLLAIFGLLIIIFCIPFILNWKKDSLDKREVKKAEIFFFISSTIIFFIVNFLIGYDWWDPNGFLGMGPLFPHSIISLIILGFLPDISKKIFKLKEKNEDDFAESTQNMKEISIIMIAASFGYGLISLIWHCCSFYNPSIYFFYFIIKIIQLWALLSFFYRWGFKMFLNIVKEEWQAYLIISILFGICYPWHTIGYAVTFTLFGILICYITRKTDSYFSGLILLYFAYIFHAGLAWNGALITFSVILLITFSVIFPISIFLMVLMIIFNVKREKMHALEKPKIVA